MEGKHYATMQCTFGELRHPETKIQFSKVWFLENGMSNVQWISHLVHILAEVYFLKLMKLMVDTLLPWVYYVKTSLRTNQILRGRRNPCFLSIITLSLDHFVCPESPGICPCSHRSDCSYSKFRGVWGLHQGESGKGLHDVRPATWPHSGTICTQDLEASGCLLWKGFVAIVESTRLTGQVLLYSNSCFPAFLVQIRWILFMAGWLWLLHGLLASQGICASQQKMGESFSRVNPTYHHAHRTAAARKLNPVCWLLWA